MSNEFKMKCIRTNELKLMGHTQSWLNIQQSGSFGVHFIFTFIYFQINIIIIFFYWVCKKDGTKVKQKTADIQSTVLILLVWLNVASWLSLRKRVYLPCQTIIPLEFSTSDAVIRGECFDENMYKVRATLVSDNKESLWSMEAFEPGWSAGFLFSTLFCPAQNG